MFVEFRVKGQVDFDVKEMKIHAYERIFKQFMENTF